MASREHWQNELMETSRARGRGKLAVFRPAKRDEWEWAQNKLREEPHLLERDQQAIELAFAGGQFYVLEDENGDLAGCGALWDVASGTIKPDPGVPCIELGAIWIAEDFRGWGLGRVLGQIGIAEAIAKDPDMEIYTGAVSTNPKSERNVRWLGFTNATGAQRIWWPRLCNFGKGCASKERARQAGRRCCVQAVKLPAYWKRDAVRAFLSFVDFEPLRSSSAYRGRPAIGEAGPLLTLSQENGDILTLALQELNSLREREALKTWLSRK
ncbi:MAG TPA: GNAT family N-acetyltransferase [Stellaceae bacterium]|nr:GNAT family N-acetyltransferase [Stellaceae bacterium]